jgi:uncharacterized iron-regulated membrane protein
MARLRLRSLWRNLHLWIGLGLFVVLAPLGVSGSLLVFDAGLDKLMHPQRYAVSGPARLDPGAYLDAARAAFGQRALPAQLRMPQGSGGPVTVQGWAPPAHEGERPGQLTAFLDPASAKVLDVANPRAELRGQLHQLHGNLFMAQPGRKLVGWLGLLMLISCLTGLYMWWPRNNDVIKGLRWTRSPSGFSNLHHMVGFWACVPLALLSFTGAAIAFPDVVRAAQGKPAQPPQPPQPPQPQRAGPQTQAAPLAQPHTAVADVIAAATAAAGGPGRVQQLTLPTQGARAAWRVQLRGPAGPVQVRVDDASGEARLQDGPPPGPGGGDPATTPARCGPPSSSPPASRPCCWASPARCSGSPAASAPEPPRRNNPKLRTILIVHAEPCS